MNMEMLKEFIQPELLVLVPVLYAIGVGMKKSERIKDNYIPAILGIIGIVLAGLWCCSTANLSSGQDIATCIFAAITQGILCASASVFVNQLIKQRNCEDNDEDISKYIL